MIVEMIDQLDDLIFDKLEQLYQGDIKEIADLLDMDYYHVYNILKVRKSIPKARLLDFLHVANMGMVILPLTEEE